MDFPAHHSADDRSSGAPSPPPLLLPPPLPSLPPALPPPGRPAKNRELDDSWGKEKLPMAVTVTIGFLGIHENRSHTYIIGIEWGLREI